MHRKAYVLLLSTMLLWAGNAIAGKLAVGHVSPMLLTAARWGLTLLVLLAIGRRHIAADWQTLRARMGYLLVMGAAGFAVFSVAMYCALLYTSATNVSIEQGGMPLFVFAASLVMFGDRATPAQVAGFLLSFAGVMVTATHGEVGRLLDLDVNFGDALMLLAIVTYGVYTAALRLKPSVHWMTLMTGLCLGAFLGSLPFAAAEAAFGATIAPDLRGWAIIAYVVVFPSLVAQSFYIRAVELIVAKRAGLFINFLPLWGALLDVTIVGEEFHVYHAVALALILGGIWLAEHSGRKMPPPPSESLG
jgi:drug/metabolite transporter (DMT)-like permease